jgi:hypothetical protein
MITRVTLGLFLSDSNMRFQAHFVNFTLMFSISFICPFNAFSVTMAENSTISIFAHFFAVKGTMFRFSCPYTSPQYGKVECGICTINDINCTLIF